MQETTFPEKKDEVEAILNRPEFAEIAPTLREYIGQLEQLNLSLKDAFREFTALQEMTRTISATHDLYDILAKVIELVGEILEYDVLLLLWLDPETGEYVPDERMGNPDGFNDDIRSHISEGLLDWVIQKKRLTIVPPSERERQGSYIIIPLVTAGDMRAVLHVYTRLDQEMYMGQHFEMLSLLTSQTAIAMENAKLWADMEDFKDYMQDTIESLHQGVIVLDARDQVTIINRAAQQMFSIAQQQNVGLSWIQVLPFDLLDAVETAITEALLHGQSEEKEVELEQNGDTLSLSVLASVLTNARGEGKGIILILRDLSETKELSELRRLNELKSKFVSNVSHELRTPITSIKAYVETLLEQVDQGDKEIQNEFLATIKQEAERLSRLIEDLLDLSRIEKDRIEFHFEDNNLCEIVRLVVNMIEPTAPNHRFVLDLKDSECCFRFDRDKIHQVVSNLVGNAVKYSPNGGDISISVKRKDGQISFSVADQGIGVKTEDLPKVFDKFFRAASQLKYQVSGTGLGLAISRYIVEAHQGRIWMESQFGHGSSVYVQMPVENGPSDCGETGDS